MPQTDTVQQSITTPENPDVSIGVRVFSPDLPPDPFGLSLPQEVGVLQRMASGHLANPDRWPISLTQREKAVGRLVEIMEKAKDSRSIARAGQVLAMFDRINLEAARDAKEPTPAVSINIGQVGGNADLSRLTTDDLAARIAALETTKPGG